MKMQNRREFVWNAARAGTLAALTAGAAGLYSASDGQKETENGFSMPDFSAERIDGKTIASVSGSSRPEMARKALGMLGGMERFVEKGDVVALKPNVAFASPESLGATTSPDLVYELSKMCFEAGAKEVLVFDNPINSPQSCFMISGISKAAERAGAKVIIPSDSMFSKYTLSGGGLIVDWPLFNDPLKKADKLIGAAPVKDHHRSGASMTMKNWYGLLGGRRNIFHQDINGIIKELAVMVKPTLVVLDGVITMMRNGPTGGSLSDLKETNTLIASTDMLAADTLGSALLDRKPESLPYLAMAQDAGVGTMDLNKAALMEAKL
ncbi:hypothetical protein L21SP3_00350 [Sedimentisphaera cyanobacteriorum]|uniref:DUF362 domain-containing protein n=1 Tax=Sedimentisphaera cyanobacteriorum TaxID=1940790 RepID=A0A1Q2HMY0_9BACT|nr:DUF362 domain-containing protein [Sedimentisphaera cyanobacteriorum]AQQ08566.1 hypothetical protein L21SP3_00350 [Sedimentisphaera cyanobacteriorum]